MILGTVLCGGESKRMGMDKGLLPSGDLTWSQLACKKLEDVGLPIVISINASQQQSYLNYFDASQLITDHPILGINGPLTGLLSVHLKYPTDSLLTLGCDMLLMESRILKLLIQTFNDNPDYDVYVFSNDHNLEPLCAIYTPSGLSSILHQHQQGGLTSHSMKFTISLLKAFVIPIHEGDKKLFSNFNTQTDFQHLHPKG
jgi:molybdenum cofactor guanylyltransferase